MADIGSLAYSATTVPDWSTTTGPGEDEFDYLTLLYIIPLVVLAVLVMVLLALLLVCGLRHMEMWILNHRHQYCTCCNCCNPNLANPDEYRHITREQDPEMYSLNDIQYTGSLRRDRK